MMLKHQTTVGVACVAGATGVSGVAEAVGGLDGLAVVVGGPHGR